MKKQEKRKPAEKIYYPSATLLQTACYEDYKRLIDTYDKIYDKISIAFGFCGVVLLVILGNFDYTLFFAFNGSKLEMFSVFIRLVCSSISVICIVWAVIQLLLLIRSRSITVFDSIAVRNEKIYYFTPDKAALWLIDKYTLAVVELRKIIDKKQRVFDSAVTKIVVAILTYAIVIIAQKGVS